MTDAEGRGGTDLDPNAPAARRRSETTTLVVAATIAVALGVACGLWINSLLSTAASAKRSAPATAAVAPTPAPNAAESQPLNETFETASAPDAPEVSEPSPTATPAPPEEQSRQSKVYARPAGTPEAERKAATKREPLRAAPCALYASASALTLRVGEAASLVIGGPGDKGSVSVSTPSWAHIAVFQEGRAANGWLRYSVRSIGKRPGLYTVRFNTPCGSQNILVTVK